MGTLVVADKPNETGHVYLSYHSLCLAGCSSTACNHACVSVWHNNPFILTWKYDKI